MRDKILIGAVLLFAFLALYFVHKKNYIIVNLKPISNNQPIERSILDYK